MPVDPTTAARLGSQQLSGTPATTPEEVVGRLLAVQAQDPRGARLAIRSRSIGLTAADVDAALTDRRSMVVAWVNRGTLHLVAAEDLAWLQALTTPQLATTSKRRLAQEGVSERQAEQGVEVIEAALAVGPTSRNDLRAALDAAGVPTARQALSHLFLATALRGHLVRGPMAGKDHLFVDPQRWLGPQPEVDRHEALGLLARRYLVAHGPADPADLVKWAGITLGDARRGFAAIADEVVPAGDGLVDLADREPAPPPPGPRLLGAFDDLLLGWADRTPITGSHSLITSNGIFHPFALVDGRAVARWSVSGRGVEVAPLEPISARTAAALEADGEDVVRFLHL